MQTVHTGYTPPRELLVEIMQKCATTSRAITLQRMAGFWGCDIVTMRNWCSKMGCWGPWAAGYKADWANFLNSCPPYTTPCN